MGSSQETADYDLILRVDERIYTRTYSHGLFAEWPTGHRPIKRLQRDAKQPHLTQFQCEQYCFKFSEIMNPPILPNCCLSTSCMLLNGGLVYSNDDSNKINTSSYLRLNISVCQCVATLWFCVLWLFLLTFCLFEFHKYITVQ